MALSPVGCQALPCVDAAGSCLAGPGREAAGCRTLWGPTASVGLLVSRVRVLKTLGLLPTHWQVKLDPGVSAGLLAGRAHSWSDCRAQGSQSSFHIIDWQGGGGQFLTQLGIVCGLSQRLHCCARAQLFPGSGLACCWQAWSAGCRTVFFCYWHLPPGG